MKQCIYHIESNEPLTGTVYQMRLSGDTSAFSKPGQFLNIALDGLFLRRPISVCDYDERGVTILYKVVGKGTAQMAAMRPGQTLDVLTGLGNGYEIEKCGAHALLLGGGVGVPPLYGLCKALLNSGRQVCVVLGFNTKDEVFYENAFRALGADVTVATADGSYGVKGFVTDALPQSYDYFFACGPEPMLKAVCKATGTSGQLSFEERMGCGFGACMGCSRQTVNGPRRVCKDGPVFTKEELLWED